MSNEDKRNLEVYNQFCESLSEGCILYNIDSTNGWGDYFLVVNKATVKLGNLKTYTMLLIGLKKEKESFSLRNTRIRITPDYVSSIPFLKLVGKCKFKLNPEIENVTLNKGLTVVYSNVNLWKFTKNLSIRKPKVRKYGFDGKPILGKVENE